MFRQVFAKWVTYTDMEANGEISLEHLFNSFRYIGTLSSSSLCISQKLYPKSLYLLHSLDFNHFISIVYYTFKYYIVV